jgi:hypothetical protein
VVTGFCQGGIGLLLVVEGKKTTCTGCNPRGYWVLALVVSVGQVFCSFPPAYKNAVVFYLD